MAVLAFQLAVSVSQTSATASELEQVWDLAIAAWISLIYSTAFWSGWNTRREQAAGILLSDEELRSLVDTVLNRFDEQLNRLRSAGAGNARVKLLKARVDYEKTCASLMRDHMREVRVADWPEGMFCGARMVDFMRKDKQSAALVDGLSRTSSSASAKLDCYALRPAEGFPTFLTENNYPRLAVDWLIASPQGLSDLQRKQLKSSAYLALGNQLAESGENWKVALESYRRAYELGANMAESRDWVVKCGIERSRETLNGDSASTDQALRALQTAKKMTGNESVLASNIAAIYSQKAVEAANAEHRLEAERLFRLALHHSDETGIRKLFAILLRAQARQFAFEHRNRALAISVAREMLQMEQGMGYLASESDARSWLKEQFIQVVGEMWQECEDKKNFEHFDLRLAIGLVAEGRWYADERKALGLHALLLNEQARLYASREQWNLAVETLGQAYQIEKTQERRAAMALFLGARAQAKLNNNNRLGALEDLKLALQWDPSNRDLLRFQSQLQR